VTYIVFPAAACNQYYWCFNDVQGFELVAMEVRSPSTTLLEQHYEEHKNAAFFPALLNFMSSGRKINCSGSARKLVVVAYVGVGSVVAMIWQGRDVVSSTRKMLGATDPKNSAPGTIRGDFGLLSTENICHASDSIASARREINLWFPNVASQIFNGEDSSEL
jgi:nucleoside-diphosphate kinase